MESSGTSPKTDFRIIEAHDWLSGLYSSVSYDFMPVTGDASFRRYFRVRVDDVVRIVMDAPPEIESCESFLDIGARLRKAGLHAPEVLAENLQLGFLMLENLGRDLYRDVIREDRPEVLYEPAFAALAVMARDVVHTGLPVYDEDSLHDDLGLFTDFYLLRHRDYSLRYRQRLDWMKLCDELVSAAREQPQVFVHKDFHSCNLLVTEENSPGIIDFQDAVTGPLTYDFVSLIWDRYIAWPRPQLELWMEQFRQLVAPEIDPQKWIYYCDMMGLQRNLRIVGRFAQLEHSEGKTGYVDMIPRFYQYALDVLSRYPQFEAVTGWIGSNECAP